MTKYGHESGFIAISDLKAGIGDKTHLSKQIIQIYIFSIHTQHFLTLTTDCQAKDSHL